MDALLSLLLGVGISAACGFRIFVPMLVMSVAAMDGQMTLAPGFEWIGTPSALMVFAVASCLEILGYYIPWVDNMLDAVAAPTAVVAGTIATAAAVQDMSPLLQWTLAVVLGGGTAGLTQALTTVTRLASTATTGGLANPLLATMEIGSAATLAIVAITLPLLAGILVLTLLYFAVSKLWKLGSKLHRQRHPAP